MPWVGRHRPQVPARALLPVRALLPAHRLVPLQVPAPRQVRADLLVPVQVRALRRRRARVQVRALRPRRVRVRPPHRRRLRRRFRIRFHRQSSLGVAAVPRRTSRRSFFLIWIVIARIAAQSQSVTSMARSNSPSRTLRPAGLERRGGIRAPTATGWRTVSTMGMATTG